MSSVHSKDFNVFASKFIVEPSISDDVAYVDSKIYKKLQRTVEKTVRIGGIAFKALENTKSTDIHCALISKGSFVKILQSQPGLTDFQIKCGLLEEDGDLSIRNANGSDPYISIQEFDIDPKASDDVIQLRPDHCNKLSGKWFGSEKQVRIGKVLCRAQADIRYSNTFRAGFSKGTLFKILNSESVLHFTAVFNKQSDDSKCPLFESSDGTQAIAQYESKKALDQQYSNDLSDEDEKDPLQTLLQSLLASPEETVPNPAPINVQAEDPSAPKIPFTEFLQNEGLIGFPHDVETTLEPIFARFGELGPYIKDRGIRGEKGILLYGPPGTGKTSLARAVAKYLNCSDERIMVQSGPSLLGKWVGETEANIRALFNPSWKAMQKLGSKSPLFVVIIDEIDAIAPDRSYATMNWEASMVNQLLSVMDGYFQRDNLLVIGMTNLRKRIDPALLRPGRFGTQIKIDLPSQEVRKEIFEVYLQPLRTHHLVAEDVDLEVICQRTEGFSGADIKGLVEKVNTRSFYRLLEAYRKKECTLEQVPTHPIGSVTMKDFQEVLQSLPPPSKVEEDEPSVRQRWRGPNVMADQAG